MQVQIIIYNQSIDRAAVSHNITTSLPNGLAFQFNLNTRAKRRPTDFLENPINRFRVYTQPKRKDDKHGKWLINSHFTFMRCRLFVDRLKGILANDWQQTLQFKYPCKYIHNGATDGQTCGGLLCAQCTQQRITHVLRPILYATLFFCTMHVSELHTHQAYYVYKANTHVLFGTQLH